jgi:hypothetical protein
MDIDKALNETTEQSELDFKKSFHVKCKGAWCEIIKDIVAMANSGGGIILIGVLDNGEPAGTKVDSIVNLDPANITNKIFSYTGQHFSRFNIMGARKDGHKIAVIEVFDTSVPIVFTKPGNYQASNGKQKNAFGVGSVYFRHGAKSEPCTSQDLREFLEREVDKVKKSWLSGIRKVVEAPQEARVVVLPATDDGAVLRIADDPTAPVVRLKEESFRNVYPFTYKQLTEQLRARYTDFLQNAKYHRIRKSLEDNPMYCKTRVLNPNNSSSSSQRFYSLAIIKEFDEYYTPKKQ